MTNGSATSVAEPFVILSIEALALKIAKDLPVRHPYEDDGRGDPHVPLGMTVPVTLIKLWF